jgi:hypothetical protein
MMQIDLPKKVVNMPFEVVFQAFAIRNVSILFFRNTLYKK